MAHTVQQRVWPRLVALCTATIPALERDVMKLTGIQPPVFRLRVGDYRVIFTFDAMNVFLMHIKHRKDAYRHL